MTWRVVLALLLLTTHAPNKPEPRFFRYYRDVNLETKTAGQACFIALPELYKNASGNLSDLRIFSGQTEIPYAIYTSGASGPNKYPDPTLLNTGERNGRLVFDVHVSHPAYSEINIDVAAKNFIATVEVSGSQLQNGEVTRLGKYNIFDLTDQKLGRATNIHLPLSNFPYLHFDLTGPLQPQQIKGIEIVSETVTPISYQTVATNEKAVQNGNQTVFTFTMPWKTPVERVEFVPRSRDAGFSRNVKIERVPASKHERQVYDQGGIFRIHKVQNGTRIDREQLSLDIPGTPIRDSGDVSWIVTIDNEDDAPLDLKEIRLQMQERLACFNYKEHGKYIVYYGDTTLTAPSYDYARVFELDTTSTRAQLGDEHNNPTHQQRADTRPFTERHTGLLWTVLIGVVGILGWIAVRSTKRINASV